ncbi:hypothetical protein E8E12_005596 [Didymella heteroderae]|uniref:Uncharacterized protein n=1 Tax=Didymella heteroderae TaxID=1769908 RepID=A0A9P4WJJ6_9PLEO|nr:hypothetical protein E8E12_005596 [Didymella heteroderae]
MASEQKLSDMDIALIGQHEELLTQQAYEEELLEEIADLQKQLREENDKISKDDIKVLADFADSCNSIIECRQDQVLSLIASMRRVYEEYTANNPEFVKAWEFLASIMKERESQDCVEDNNEIKKLEIVKSFAKLRKEVGG